MDLNKLAPAALRAAMKGGTAAWGQIGSASEHVRYSQALPKIKARRRCSCGCGNKATHIGMANGVGLTRGCELSIQRWVKTGSKSATQAAPAAASTKESA